MASIPEEERGDLLAAYHRRLMDPAPTVHLPAAVAWKSYEMACTTLQATETANLDASPHPGEGAYHGALPDAPRLS